MKVSYDKWYPVVQPQAMVQQEVFIKRVEKQNAEHALQVQIDNTVKKYVPLDLFPDQITLVQDYDNYNENIALKYRQAGVSTVTAAWASNRLTSRRSVSKDSNLSICEIRSSALRATVGSKLSLVA